MAKRNRTTLAALLLASIYLLGSSALAEEVIGLYSARLVLSSGAVEGYIPLNMNIGFSPSNPNALKKLQEHGTIWIYQDLQQTAPLPEGGHLKFITKKPLTIQAANIVKIIPLKWPLNGLERGPVATVTARQAKLLKRKPVAFCMTKYSSGEYWFSFRKEVDQSKLELLCESQVDEYAPNGKELKKIAATPDVFVVSLQID